MGFKGVFTFTKRKVPKWLLPFEKLGMWKFVNQCSPIISVKQYHNLFLDAGRHTVLDRMVGVVTKTGTLTYLALGTGTTAAAVIDVKLVTETYRHVITEAVRNANSADTTTYIPTDEGANTYKEVALFGDDATAVADSGTSYTRQIISETKNAGESLTIDYSIGC